jgi:hypothetical protein
MQVIAIQAEYNSEENMIPQSSSMVAFTELIGGIIGIACVCLAFLSIFIV